MGKQSKIIRIIFSGNIPPGDLWNTFWKVSSVQEIEKWLDIAKEYESWRILVVFLTWWDKKIPGKNKMHFKNFVLKTLDASHSSDWTKEHFCDVNELREYFGLPLLPKKHGEGEESL